MFQKVLRYTGRHRKTTYASILVLVAGVAMSVLPYFFLYRLLRPLLTLMQTPEDVARLAADYLVVIFGGLLATFFYNLCAAALRSVGDTRSALLALLAFTTSKYFLVI